MSRIQIKHRFMRIKIALSALLCVLMFIEATYDVTHHRIWQSWIYFFVTAIWVNTTRLAIKNWQLLKQIRLAERERIKRVTFTVKPSSNGHAVYTITNLSARKDDQK